MYEAIIDVYIQMIEFCIPFTVVFGIGNLAIGTIMRAIYTGKVTLK